MFKRKQEELPSLCLLWFSLAYFSPKNLFLHFVQDVRHTKRPCAVWCRAFLYVLGSMICIVGKISLAYFLGFLIAAWAAAKRAIGTRYGEQET